MYKYLLEKDEYQFLNNDFFKNHQICYLTLSGSYAYGTNNENSDIDIRGFYLENKNDFFILDNIQEEYIDNKTDTVLYSFKKFIKLLTKCNPNIIELLGTNEEHILKQNIITNILKKNINSFLSKQVYITFIGYATAQLRRLENALSNNTHINSLNKDEFDMNTQFNKNTQFDKNTQILNSINASLLQEQNNLNLYGTTEFSLKDDIYININLENVPMKKLINFSNNLNTTINNFNKLNHRNRKKDDNHLFKHAMHLIRLYYTGIDILNTGQINTYRKELILKEIRNGKLSMQEIFQLKDNLQKEINIAYANTTLPEKPNYNKINRLMIHIYNNYVI